MARSELLERFLLPRPSVEDRFAEGKHLRTRVPREAHAAYQPPPQRRNPVDILLEQAKTRLPQLVPIRHTRMLESPFAFLRGAAAVMAADLRRSPVSGINVQACGDMHAANLGVFASAERNLVFGINDFDETLIGPWEWDLKRLAASVAVINRFIGDSKRNGEDAIRAMVSSYREHMREYAEYGFLESWYARIDEDEVMNALSPRARKRVKAVFDKARTRTHLQVLDKMTALVDDKQRIVEDRPLIVRETHAADGTPILEALEMFLKDYMPTLIDDRRRLLSQYQILDVARKVVGVGSVGTRCWIIFLRGRDGNDPLFLQVKEAQPSVLATYGGLAAKAGHEGKRIVDGQRLIQGAPDIFLGWGSVKGLSFYVRQLRDMKGGVEISPESDKEVAAEYCGLCGWALALAHTRGGDAAKIAGYVGRSEALDDAIVEFAWAYADQTEADHAEMVKAAKTGRIEVADEHGRVVARARKPAAKKRAAARSKPRAPPRGRARRRPRCGLPSRLSPSPRGRARSGPRTPTRTRRSRHRAPRCGRHSPRSSRHRRHARARVPAPSHTARSTRPPLPCRSPARSRHRPSCRGAGARRT